jgi:hypothetical protein
MTPPDSAVLNYAAPATRSRFRWLDTLGWAAYLGVSWTWCIGMFLPVLLIRDYGVAGWWAFAIPNVIGAAAMGWIIRSRVHSEQLVQAHRPVIRLFSVVTVAFHVFFVRWMMSQLAAIDDPGWVRAIASGPTHYIWPVVLILPFLSIYCIGRGRGDRAVAIAVLFVSSVIAMVGAKYGLLAGLYDPYRNSSSLMAPRMEGTKSPIDLIYLTFVMVFGFLLCPYLDQTFHRARQKAPNPRRTFALGFGVFFLAMIVMTLGYSVWFGNLHLVSSVWLRWTLGWTVPLGALIWAHLMVQSGITMELHLRDATRSDGRELTVAAAVSLALAYAGGIFASLANSNGEDTYRIFMGFYALIFPAYVLICMQPWRKVTAAPSARQWTFFTGAVLLAGPFFLMGITGENRLPMFCGLLVVLVMAAAERMWPLLAGRNHAMPTD